ncbi:hypothetical protein [Chryseolinea sp. H1M3-3]|uniref:hypothetical protein n=1 Tax=Chryseolinea sp. H1M3-3 TaxID=3034144 RepID=UPI0023EAF144|nr:hypothetical protein [Chryseolinea sp. H1M3-3]
MSKTSEVSEFFQEENRLQAARTSDDLFDQSPFEPAFVCHGVEVPLRNPYGQERIFDIQMMFRIHRISIVFR